jgi:hypothetical protein
MTITLLPQKVQKRIQEKAPEEDRHSLNDDFDAPQQSLAASHPYLSNFILTATVLNVDSAMKHIVRSYIAKCSQLFCTRDFVPTQL